MLEEQPVEVVVWSLWQKIEEVDPDKPVIVVSVFHNGPMDGSREYTKPIHDLGPVAYMSGETEYPGLSALLGVDVNGPLCQPQGTVLVPVRGIDVIHYDIGALRDWFEVVGDVLTTDDALGNSVCMLEGYSAQAVQAVPRPPDSTAFPHRNQRLLLSPVIQHDSVGNSTLDQEAERWSKVMATAAFGGAQRRTYVNYALGDESLQALYGYEPWRLEKLRALKRKYDPENRFRFFVPIVRHASAEPWE